MSEPLALLIRRAAKAIGAAYDEQCGHDAPTLPQFFVLETLFADGPLGEHSIVERTAIDRSTLSDMLRRMSEAGDVTLERSRPDSRVVVATITKKGVKRFKAAQAKLGAAEASLLFQISSVARERRAFLAALAALSRVTK